MNENHLEQACLGWLESLEFTSLKGEVVSPGGTEGGREKYSEVVLQNRLRDAIERLNPGISSAEADAAVSRLALYSAQSMVDGNREVTAGYAMAYLSSASRVMGREPSHGFR